jgi:hypothetical protein
MSEKRKGNHGIGNKVVTAPPTISVRCFSHVLRVFAYPLSLSDANSRRYGSLEMQVSGCAQKGLWFVIVCRHWGGFVNCTIRLLVTDVFVERDKVCLPLALPKSLGFHIVRGLIGSSRLEEM